MEHTHDDGMVMVCHDCAPKPGKFTGQEPKSFVGKLVKVAFKAFTPTGEQTWEHMWVEVTEVAALDWLKGILRNEPCFRCTFSNGDSVGFKVSEIEDVRDMPATMKVS